MKLVLKYLYIVLFINLFFIISQNSFAKNNIFWEVKNNKATVYLLGSVHFGSDEMYPLDTSIENSFSRSKYLVTEIRMDNITTDDIKLDFFLKKKDSLQAYISDTTYQKVLKYFQSKQMTEMFVKKLSPTGVFLTISQLESLKAGLKADKGIDMYFINKSSDKEKLELESIRSQFKIFDIFKGHENELVEYALSSNLEQENTIDTLVNAWIKGDLNTLESLVLNDYNQDTSQLGKKFAFEMLDSRNVKMENKIEQYLKTDDTYFVIVGAAHLVGTKGIIKMLEDKKYKVLRR
jgi:uncharacterized protein